MRKISVQNDIIKDILRKKNDVHWISDGTVVYEQASIVYFCLSSVYSKTYLTYKTHEYVLYIDILKELWETVRI